MENQETAKLLASKFKVLAEVMKTTPEFGAIATAHIAAKHGLFTLPAFIGSPDITAEAKIETIREIGTGFTNTRIGKPHGLLGASAGGQAKAEAQAKSEPKKPGRVTPDSGCKVIVLPVGAAAPKPGLGGENSALMAGYRGPATADDPENRDRDGEGPTRRVILDRPPPGGWKPEDAVPAHLRRLVPENPLPRRDSVLPEVKPEPDQTDELRALIRKLIGPTGAGLDAAQARQIAEDVARSAFHAAMETIKAQMDALRVDMELYALRADDAAVERFKAHIASFTLSLHAKKAVA